MTDKEPDWDKIQLMHCWGGKNLEGLYSTACNSQGIYPMRFEEAKALDFKKPLDAACQDLLSKNIGMARAIFDYILIDEGQDLPPHFYRLCRSLVQKNRLVWAYDDCQNIYGLEMQDTKTLFGSDPNGKPWIDFTSMPDADVILRKCYRNPREVLYHAFALGLGIFDPKGPFQLPESNAHWESLGFEVSKGQGIKGDKMEILRPEENSPIYLNDTFTNEETVKCRAFSSEDDEIAYVVACIEADIKAGLKAEDIMVVCLDDIRVPLYFSALKAGLNDRKIDVFNVQEQPSSSRIFAMPETVTLSTVHKAKGNEAGSIYALGVDGLFDPIQRQKIGSRNKIFVAITRSKAWVTLTGVGTYANDLVTEYDAARGAFPVLKFIMKDRGDLKMIQYDLGEQQKASRELKEQIEAAARKLDLTYNDYVQTYLNVKREKGKTK